jgi:hypothetical protein
LIRSCSRRNCSSAASQLAAAACVAATCANCAVSALLTLLKFAQLLADAVALAFDLVQPLYVRLGRCQRLLQFAPAAPRSAARATTVASAWATAANCAATWVASPWVSAAALSASACCCEQRLPRARRAFEFGAPRLRGQMAVVVRLMRRDLCGCAVQLRPAPGEHRRRDVRRRATARSVGSPAK